MTEQVDSKLDRGLSEEFLRKLVAWQNLEDSLNGYSIVDLKLVEVEFKAQDNFPNRESVRDWLQDHIERTPQNFEAGRRHAQRCDGLLALDEALLGKREPLNPYLLRTLGITPAVISDSEIRDQKDKVADLFSNLGLSYNDSGWRRFQEDEPPTRKRIEQVIKDAQKRLTPIVLDTIGQPDLPLDFRNKVVRRDRPYVSRLIGGPNIFDREINVHPRNQFRYFRGMEEPLEVHEFLHHLIQALVLRENVRSGQSTLDQAITTIPGKEQWAMESMAQALPFYIPEIMEGMSDYGRFALEYNLLRDMVLNNNVLIFANADGYTDQYIQDYITENLLGQPRDRIIPELISLRREDPRYRSYYYSYTGSYYLRREAANLSSDGKRATLVYSYNNLPAPDQMVSFIEQQKAA